MGSVDRQELIEHLEHTRAEYHELLASVSSGDVWHRKSGNPDMLVKELMWHMAWAIGWLARSVGQARLQRRPLLNRVPGGLADPLRAAAMRVLARHATPARTASAYDAGHGELLAKLQSVTDDEWQRATRRFGAVRTVEWHFRQPMAHFEEHAADVRTAL